MDSPGLTAFPCLSCFPTDRLPEKLLAPKFLSQGLLWEGTQMKTGYRPVTLILTSLFKKTLVGHFTQ